MFGDRKGVASKIRVQKDVVEAGAATRCGPQGVRGWRSRYPGPTLANRAEWGWDKL